MISRSAHGFPWAARPTITAAAPVVASTACARACEVMSPEAITGTSTRETSSAVSEWSAVPGVHLPRRARMEGQRRRARLDEPRPDLEARARAVLGAAAHLHRDRQRRGRRDGRDDARGVIRVVEQRRAGAGLRHLLDRAAEVDVDDVRARGLDRARGLGHRDRVGAEDLDRERMLVGGDAQIAERPLVAVLDAGHRHHLGADEPGAVAASLAAEGLHADARHRREHEAARDLDVPDEPGLAEIDLHGVWMVAVRLAAPVTRRYYSRPLRAAHRLGRSGSGGPHFEGSHPYSPRATRS